MESYMEYVVFCGSLSMISTFMLQCESSFFFND